MYAQTTPKSVADEGNACKRKSDSDTEVAVGQCPGAGQANVVALADRIELWPIDGLRPYGCGAGGGPTRGRSDRA
jgi:hypothetical protein